MTEMESSSAARRLAVVFGVVGYGFALAGVALLGAWLAFGPTLPPEKPGAWVSVFGFPAAMACGTLGAIWLDGRAALRAGRTRAACGYGGLGLVLLGVVVAAFWLLGGRP